MTTSTTTATFSQQVSISQGQFNNNKFCRHNSDNKFCRRNSDNKFCRHNSDNKFCRHNSDNSFAGTTPTTVLQTQLRYNNPGSELAIDNGEDPTTTRRTTWRKNQHQYCDWQRLAWAHLRFATSLPSQGATWSTLRKNASTTTSSLTTWLGTSRSTTTTSDWACHSTRGMHHLIGCVNSEHLRLQNNRGCITQIFSAKCFRSNQQKGSSAFIVHIDIDSDIQEQDRQHWVQRVLWQQFLDGKLNLQQGLVCD